MPDLIDAKNYNGPATCTCTGCENPARWMPVLVFIAKGHRESKDTRVPMGLLGLGTCDPCREPSGKSLAEDVAPQMAERVWAPMRRAGLEDIRFDRIEWVEIAKVA